MINDLTKNTAFVIYAVVWIAAAILILAGVLDIDIIRSIR